MHGMSVFEEFVDRPSAEPSHPRPAGSTAVRACDGEGDLEPDPAVLLVLQAAGDQSRRAAREPALCEVGGGGGALVRVIRLQAAPVGA